MWFSHSPCSMNTDELVYASTKMFKSKQRPDELANLLNTVRGRDLSAVLEIGSDVGGTLLLWSALSKSDATLISIDMEVSEHIAIGWSVMLRDSQIGRASCRERV